MRLWKKFIPPIGAVQRLLFLFFVLMLGVSRSSATDGLTEGRFGLALEASQRMAQVEAHPAYAQLPLTVECWARLDAKSQFNVLLANETKASPTHWEFFTTPSDGHFCVYLPGRTPDHARTGVDIADGAWHALGMILEATRVRLFVDGVQLAEVALSAPPASSIPGALTIGALSGGELSCAGRIDEVRISQGVRPITAPPEGEWASDAQTIGLWHFNEASGDSTPDANGNVHPAKLIRISRDLGYTPMSAAYQPLPPPEDTRPLRNALREIRDRLSLKSVDPAGLQNSVLCQWSRDFEWYGKFEYPAPGGRTLFYQDPEAVKQQVYDPEALIRAEDGGPAGTVLRRTAALIRYLEKAGQEARIASVVQDFNTLRADYEKLRPTPDSPQHRACYLAACALRRQIALTNPLLDFDSILCVARGTFAGSVRSNPANADAQGGHLTTQYFGFNALPGGGLYQIRNFKSKPEVVDVVRDSVVENGRLQGQKLEGGAFATPDLSFDGKKIVFAWTEKHAHLWNYSRKTCWHLFTVNADGTNLRQLTDGAYDDFDPCWLPNGRIAFVSERRGGFIRCFSAYLSVRNYTLFSMEADGRDIRSLSYYETSEWNPTVNNEGKLVYTRWDYTDRANCLGTRIWIAGPDGTDPRAPHGNYPHPFHTFKDHTPWRVWNNAEWDSRLGTPMVEMGIRAVPDSPQYIFTAAPHHGEIYGSLCMLDLRQNDDGHMAQVRRITPDEPFPESEQSERRHYKYGTPWPLSEDFYLCNVWENLCLLDRFGNLEPLCALTDLPCVQDERLRLTDPIPLRLRARPPILPDKTNHDQNTSPDARRATLAVMNVYNSDLPLPPGVKIKWLRITQNILKTNHTMGEPMIGYERENTPRLPLGIVPVEADGSAYFEAPVAKELIFQALDEDYCAVQSMRSVAYVHPGESLTCQGCHEPRNKVPTYTRPPQALQRPPSSLQPEIGPLEPISYYRQIKPIFDTRCVKCHTEQGKGPRDMSYDALKEGYTFWFSGAMGWDGTRPYSGEHGGSRTIPGRFGARASRIGQALFTEAHKAAVPAEERHKIVVWLDSNSLRLGAFERESDQMRGELVWPELDVDPLNVLGIEGRGRPLRGNFWHENVWGPHAFLGTSHTRKSVYLRNEQGAIVWEYPAPNPQEVWMLSNGHILIAWLHGVQEVTRDKQVLWEYKVEAPNEVPNCQPLPDGNILIGIVGQCRLIEVNRRGEVVHEIPLKTTESTPHAQFRMCRKTPQGTYLVPFTAEGAVREIDRDGRVLREFPRRPTPVCALRLSNGNTLISADRAVTEYAPDNRIVWQLTEDDLPDLQIATPAGIQRLPTGNTLVCNWNASDMGGKVGAHIFEVTPEKQVVWQVTGTDLGQVAQCQILNPDFTPIGEGINR
jgi:hypothetical protein